LRLGANQSAIAEPGFAHISSYGAFTTDELVSRELYFLELRKAGANVHLPCVNHSDYYTNISGNDVYAGFVHMKSLEQKLAECIITERSSNGHYLHLQDFIERTAITREQLNLLVSIGAFRFTGKGKKELLWEANFLQAKNKSHVPAVHSLFEEPPFLFDLPKFTENHLDDRYDEMEILDFPLGNPFDLVDDDPQRYAFAKDMEGQPGKHFCLLVYFICQKPVATFNGQTMCFGTFLDANLDWVDTIHFPEVLRNYPLKGRGFYKISGKAVEDFGVISIEVAKMIRIGYKPGTYSKL